MMKMVRTDDAAARESGCIRLARRYSESLTVMKAGLVSAFILALALCEAMAPVPSAAVEGVTTLPPGWNSYSRIVDDQDGGFSFYPDETHCGANTFSLSYCKKKPWPIYICLVTNISWHPEYPPNLWHGEAWSSTNWIPGVDNAFPRANVTVTWTVDIPRDGCYTVAPYIYWNQSAQVTYVISHKGGPASVTIAQFAGDRCSPRAEWVTLGNFQFTKGPWTVQVNNNTGETDRVCLLYDAMSWVLTAAPRVEFQLVSGDRCGSGGTPVALSGQRIRASNATGEVFTGVTDANGHATFDDERLLFGDYTASVDGSPEVCHFSVQNCEPVSVELPVCAGSIRVCKYDDGNFNSTVDAGEEVTGWPFHITGPGTDTTGNTDASGCVTFSNLTPGAYTISEDVSVDSSGNATVNNKRWRILSDNPQTVQLGCSENGTIKFANVRLGTITAHKFDDSNMNGTQDAGESDIPDWPVRLVPVSSQAPGFPTAAATLQTDANGDAVFRDLLPGVYTVQEDLTWESVSPCAGDPYTVQRATRLGKRWQATTDIEATLTLPEGEDLTQDFGNVCLGTVNALKFWDKNMSGTRQVVAEAFTDSNLNGKWDPAELFSDINGNGVWDGPEPYTDTNHNGRYDAGEPFTTLNGNLCWDGAEPLRDENGNGVWDPAEPWVDTFANGVWDDAEGGLEQWPVALYGTDAAGRCVGPIEKESAADGSVSFADIPPGTYRVYENTPWRQTVDWTDMSASFQTLLSGLGLDERRTTYAVDGRRWFATTAPASEFAYAECASPPTIEFGNECTATISGSVVEQDCPDSPPAPLAGWTVEMEKHDVEQQLTFAPLPLPSTDPDCQNQPWERVTAPDGSFWFGELAPGVYKLRLVIPTGYNQTGDPVELCTAFRVACEDVEKTLAVRDILAVCDLYQAYPARTAVGSGSGLAQQAAFRGYGPPGADPITAIGGVFSIDPGSKWANYVNASGACAPYCIKNVTLIKEHQAQRQCYDVFPTYPTRQQGTPGIRTWWPLLYEPPGTTWTLTILYGTTESVQLPGEIGPGYVHSDRWKWQIAVTLSSFNLLLDVLHTNPFGTDEVPLISDERVYGGLKALTAAALAAQTPDQALANLSEMELIAVDACIGASPMTPAPGGIGTGIAQTLENPACCKILTDIDYLLRHQPAP